jgi:putative FmdB family regulatory protein
MGFPRYPAAGGNRPRRGRVTSGRRRGTANYKESMQMPLYEYKCRKCGALFEALLSVASRDIEEKKLTCPTCGTSGPKRQISNFASSGSEGHDHHACSPRRG